MLVKFRTNLGSIDGQRLGLDYRQCARGSVVDVSDAAAKELLKRGVVVEQPALKGVSERPAVREVKSPEVQAEPKATSKPAPLASRFKQSEKQPSNKDS